MRLLINAIPLLGEESGVGAYARQIAIAALARPKDFDVTFFYGYRSGKLAPPSGSSGGSWPGALKKLISKGGIARRICKKALYLADLARQTVNPATYDCYFEPNFVTLPTIRSEKSIVAVHDFSCFRYPQWHPAERARHMEKYFWKSAQKADALVTVSEAIRQEAIDVYGLSPDRITAIPNGVDHRLFRPVGESARQELRKRYDLPENFALFVGTTEPRKNLRNLLIAYAGLPESLKNRFPLLLVGSSGWNNGEILELIRQNRRFVRQIGYAPQMDLPAFYSSATIFVYPSWYEGFGLPALEAMACGRAVLVSDDPALVELCGDAAARVSPGDVDAMRENMRQMLEDPQARAVLEQKALKKAAGYSWDLSGEKHARLFLEVCGA